jgi:LysM repeat protein
MMNIGRYKPRHLKPKPRKHGPVVFGTAAAVALGAQGTAFAGTYRVRPGDTLANIARGHHTTISALARRNHLSNPNFIVSGTTLKVPGGASLGGSSIHVVQAGETLSGIAARYGTTVAALAHVNDLADPNTIAIGAGPRGKGG